MKHRLSRFSLNTAPTILLLGILAELIAFTAAQGPSPAADLDLVEQKLLEHARKHQFEAIEILQRVVDINSGTMNFDGVREVGRHFRKEFDELDFETRWIDGAAFGRAGHLWAERLGDGPRVLLIGHLDTVFEPHSPFQKFEKSAADQGKGPGSVDMKGGNVVIIQALKALREAGVLNRISLRVILTGDEEKSGRPLDAARQVVREAADWADIALGFEDGDGDPGTAVVARRGSTSWRIEVNGNPAHSSQIFRKDIGYGSIFEAARILNKFREELSEEPLLTFNPGTILGGTTVAWDSEQAQGTAFGKENVIAETTIISGDIRCISLEQLETSKRRMREIVSRHLPHTHARIIFDDGYPPLAPTPGNYRLLEIYDRVSQDLGFGPVKPVDPRKAGAADISFTGGLIEMALYGLGLMGDDGHTVNETADLRTLPSQTARAAVLLYRLSKIE